ncbi:MAG TPA: glycosyltransferase family 4 protein [Bacteroidales bacterium]|nr:glycosyltransferase family 4 protein [Bacteroidales bacterium]HSA42058.1 glycosyltransferase family 4 protein [Bacteroidales bacterium]
MRITIYTSGDFPHGLAPENFVRQMALGLQAAGAGVNVIRWRGRRYPHPNDTTVPAGNFLFPKPFQHEILKFAELILLILFIPFKLIYRKIFHRDQVVVLYGLEYFYIVFPFLLICRLTAVKCFRVITDSYTSQAIAPVFWKRPKVFFYRLQSRCFDRFLNGVLVLSEHLREDCLRNGLQEGNILLIPHFIDLKRQDATEGPKPVKNRIGYVGTPSPANGILDLAAAFRIVSERLPDPELMIAGKTGMETEKEISSIAGSKGKVLFRGMLPGVQAREAMLSCAVLVNPRKTGLWADAGFPTKLGEYFSTCIPVVQTRVGDPSRYLTDLKEVVFAEPDNPESLADAILYVLEDPVRAEAIGKNGFDWALAKLDHLTNGKKLLAFIKAH